MKFKVTFEDGSEIDVEAPSWISALYVARAHARKHGLPEVPVSMLRDARPAPMVREVRR